jgi:hypothetical protein
VRAAASALGDRQPPGAAGVGGIDDHRDASGHRFLDALVQPLLDIHPGALHRGIPENFGTDHVGGEQHRRRLSGVAEQGRQGAGEGGFAAGGLADQQVAAQRGTHGALQAARGITTRGGRLSWRIRRAKPRSSKEAIASQPRQLA